MAWGPLGRCALPGACWTGEHRGVKRVSVFLAVTCVGLAAGVAASLSGASTTADVLWAATGAVGLAAAFGWVIASLIRHRLGVDVIAVFALAGALAVGEFLAAAIVAVMLASGRVLEARAAGQAERELRGLLGRTPGTVHRYEVDELVSVSLDAVTPGDLLLVKPGEVVPVDGRVEGADAVLDESALTGEALPIVRPVGDAVRSGVVNAGGPIDLRVTTTAEESTYAGVVRLVEAARADQAPFVRLADRYALWFVPLAVLAALLAWALSGDAVRAVAVLVVATPCPLLLAAPIAIVSGMSRCAHRGVIVKDGGALERLAQGRVLLFDKTGTITRGVPTVASVAVAPTVPLQPEEVLRPGGEPRPAVAAPVGIRDRCGPRAHDRGRPRAADGVRRGPRSRRGRRRRRAQRPRGEVAVGLRRAATCLGPRGAAPSRARRIGGGVRRRRQRAHRSDPP